MSYIKTVCLIHDRAEIAKHYDIRYGAPGMPREKKVKETPEVMARQNLWQRKKYLRRLIELNFGEGDWHITLTCRPEDRPCKEDAPRLIRKFRDRMRKAYKQRGWELRYIITCETGKRGAVHWHMIVNDMHDGRDSTAGLVGQFWIWGRPYFSPLDDTGEYGRLAEYLVKESSDRIRREETGENFSYMRSRNLVKPVEKPYISRARSWRREPRMPAGWELVPGTLINGVNPYNGLPYQYYTMRRIRDEDGGRLYRDGPARVRERAG